MGIDRRYLKAGVFIVMDGDTGAVTIVRRYPGIEQRRRREKFVVKNRDLCRKAFAKGHCHRDHKTEQGRKLVDKARRKLGYSPTTGSGDIFGYLWCSWYEMGFGKPVDGCTCGWCRRMRAEASEQRITTSIKYKPTFLKKKHR